MWGGGNFITENYPTNFHTFFTRKVLTHSDDISNYREVTATERAAIEQSDAAWLRPPQAFIDQAVAAGMEWYDDTGFFGLNGLRDITYTEALKIFMFSAGKVYSRSESESDNNISNVSYAYLDVRTCLPFVSDSKFNYLVQLRNLYKYSNVEVVRLSTLPAVSMVSNTAAFCAFDNCRNLREILTTIEYFNDAYGCFRNCVNLEEVRIAIRGSAVNLKDSPKLSYNSVLFMGTHNLNSGESPITITVHADVYAKLTGDKSNAAVSVLDDKDADAWAALLPLAATHNITFATT